MTKEKIKVLVAFKKFRCEVFAMFHAVCIDGAWIPDKDTNASGQVMCTT